MFFIIWYFLDVLSRNLFNPTFLLSVPQKILGPESVCSETKEEGIEWMTGRDTVYRPTNVGGTESQE